LLNPYFHFEEPHLGNSGLDLYCMHPVAYYKFIILVKYQSAQRFCDEQISATVLAFVCYCMLGYHQTVAARMCY
jgi:hypothetical protein